MRATPTLLISLIILGLVVAGGVLIWRPAIDPIERPDPASFDHGLVAKGAALAAVGNCVTCHTAPAGQTFAGGFPLDTPFGTIYGTNITPDPETGIGRWSEAAFVRALHDGLDRAGHHLYPAFPYDHFTRVTDEDAKALYAYLMTREPVNAEPPKNNLHFPFNIRPLVAGWKLLYLDHAPFKPDDKQNEEWNRGAYLADALGHCTSCHSPRNALGAEKTDAPFAGGESEGWSAPALNASAPAPIPWNEDQLYAFLRHGVERLHGIAAGPMTDVTRNLAQASDDDVHAIAHYMASVVGEPSPERKEKSEQLLVEAATPLAPPDSPGAELFVGSCATCHDSRIPAPLYRAVPLQLSSAVTEPDPRNLIHIILAGIRPAEGRSGPMMPGFGGSLTDTQIAALAAHLRKQSGQPEWKDLEKTVSKLRAGRDAGS
jgi:mono/diheme cytochrome c family protein